MTAEPIGMTAEPGRKETAMRVMINTWAWPTHYYQLVPLAWALRAAAHEVIVAAPPAQTPVIEATGLPAYPVGRDIDVVGMVRRIVEGGKPPPAAAWTRRVPQSSVMWLSLAESMVDDLVSLARAWRPDLMLFEPTSWAGPLAAAAVGVPAVRHPWGADIMAAMRHRDGVRDGEMEALAPLCERLGIEAVDTLGALTVDPCPSGMQQPGLTHRRAGVRYVPYNGPRRVADWMFEPPKRPRVCVTWGTTVGRVAPDRVLAGPVARALADTGLDVVVAVDEAQVSALGEVPAGVRVATSVALHALVPTCAAVIGHGGAGTIMTGLVSGLPQLAIPLLPDHRFNAARLAASGAGFVIDRDEATPVRVREALSTIMEDLAYRKSAEELRSQIAAEPRPADLVPVLEELARG